MLAGLPIIIARALTRPVNASLGAHGHGHDHIALPLLAAMVVCVAITLLFVLWELRFLCRPCWALVSNRVVPCSSSRGRRITGDAERQVVHESVGKSSRNPTGTDTELSEEELKSIIINSFPVYQWKDVQTQTSGDTPTSVGVRREHFQHALTTLPTTLPFNAVNPLSREPPNQIPYDGPLATNCKVMTDAVIPPLSTQDLDASTLTGTAKHGQDLKTMSVDKCMMCSQAWKDKDQIRNLKCKCDLYFHKGCIDRWLESCYEMTCPSCFENVGRVGLQELAVKDPQRYFQAYVHQYGNCSLIDLEWEVQSRRRTSGITPPSRCQRAIGIRFIAGMAKKDQSARKDVVVWPDVQVISI